MGVKIITDIETGEQVIYDSVTMTAFGPVFSSEDDVVDFLEWLSQDARKYEQRELDDEAHRWRKQRKEEEDEKAAERWSENQYEGDGNFADNH